MARAAPAAQQVGQADLLAARRVDGVVRIVAADGPEPVVEPAGLAVLFIGELEVAELEEELAVVRLVARRIDDRLPGGGAAVREVRPALVPSRAPVSLWYQVEPAGSTTRPA